jgi:hypothetical protein
VKLELPGQGVPKPELGNEGKSYTARGKFNFPSPCGRGLRGRGKGEGDFLTFVILFA